MQEAIHFAVPNNKQHPKEYLLEIFIHHGTCLQPVKTISF